MPLIWFQVNDGRLQGQKNSWVAASLLGKQLSLYTLYFYLPGTTFCSSYNVVNDFMTLQDDDLPS